MQEYHYRYEEGKVPEVFSKIAFMTWFVHEKLLKQVMEASRIREYEPGEEMISEGDMDRWVYILLTGRLRVTKGGELVTTLDHTGELIGELRVIENGPRTATVTALARVICLAVDISFVDGLNEADRYASTAMIYRLFSKELAERLRNTTEELRLARQELEDLKRK